MNQDFAIEATPAFARRLIHLQRYTAIDLPPALASLALLDTITPDDFNTFTCAYSEERATITQFLLDTGLRAIVLAHYHPCMDEFSLLNAIRLRPIHPISIITTRLRKWSKVSKSMAMKVKLSLPSDVDGAWIDNYRRGVLILDLSDQNHRRLSHLFREFPRLIVYQSLDVPQDAVAHWTLLAAALCPSMPHPLLKLLTPKLQQPLRDFALFYNFALFPQYISSKLLAILDESSTLKTITSGQFEYVSL